MVSLRDGFYNRSGLISKIISWDSIKKCFISKHFRRKYNN